MSDVWWLLVVSHILTLQTCGSPTWRSTFFPSTLSKKFASWRPHNHGQMQVFLKILCWLTCGHFSYTSTQETWNPLVSDLEDIDFRHLNLRVGLFFGGRKTMHFVFRLTSRYTNWCFAASVELNFFSGSCQNHPTLKGFYHKVQFPTSRFPRKLSASNPISKFPNLPRHDPGNLPLENSQQTGHLQSIWKLYKL